MSMPIADDSGWSKYEMYVIDKLSSLDKRLDVISNRMWGIISGLILVVAKFVFDYLTKTH